MKDGICATCTKGHACTYPTAFKGITQCDEYEGESNGNAKAARGRESATMVEPLHGEMNLCLTCNASRTCTYPSASTGVVECADYC